MMKQVQLGGLTVSAEGLGCMGMSSVYGAADGTSPSPPSGVPSTSA